MTAAPRDPFKFLDPYTRADRDIFFGRDRETEELYARLLASGLLLVYGVSGTGKTSLVQCGLANKFEPADCLAITVRRGANLLESLDAELARHALTPAPPGAPLTKRVRSLYLDHFKPIHLIFDQLEELFIFGDREERRAFGLALQELSSLERDVRLIFVVREEYLGAMTEFEPLLPDLFRSRIRIERMDRFQAREAIEGPCQRCGVTLDPGVAEAVLTRLAPAEATVELTWLQVVMDRLYRQAADQDPERPALTLAGLAGLGRLDNVLGRFLEEQLTALDQPLAGEAVLKALVSGDGTRRPLSLAAIAESATVRAQGLTGEALPALIQRLIAARILSDRDEHGNYELRHDSLARKVWERMTAREKELQEIRQTIDIRFRDYRRRGLLLDAETLTYLAPYEDSLFLPPEQAGFVKASREAAARKRRRWLTLAFSTLILVLVVVSGLGVYGYLKAAEAERQAAEAMRKEKDARHNLGFMFLEKGERARDEHRFNEARVYALHALANFDPQRSGLERAANIVLNNPVYPPAFSSRSSAQHEDRVFSVRFSPDGRTLASGSYDNTIRLWDLATGQERGRLAGHTESVLSVAYSPDGRTLASGSWDQSIRLWDLATGQERARLEGDTGPVYSVAFSPDGQTLAAGSADNTIRLWDLGTDQVRARLMGHTDLVWSVAFSPDGRTLASGSHDKTIRLWDLATGQERARLAGDTDLVWSVAFSPDGRTLASGSGGFGDESKDNTVRLWDAATGQERARLAGHTDRVTSVAFSPNGRTLASGSHDKTIRLWDLATGQERARLAGHTDLVTSVAFSPDGRTLASGSDEHSIRLWDLAAGQERAPLAGHTDSVLSVAFSPDGRTLASASGDLLKATDNTVRLWDLATDQERARLAGHSEPMESVAFSPDGRTLASGSHDKTIRLWDLATGQERARLAGHTEPVLSIAFSPDSRTLASGSTDRTIRLWDLATGQERVQLAGHTKPVLSIAFSPDGRTLASGSTDRTIRLWDLAAGQELARLLGHMGPVSSVAFSPDGRTLTSGSDDKTIRLWDLATDQERARLAGHTGRVFSIAFSPDGRTLASGSGHRTIRLWDLATCQERAQLTGQANSIAFSPDGRTLASGSGDNTIRLWDLEFLYDPRPLEEQVKDAEAQFGLRLVDLQLQPVPPDPAPDGAPAQPPRWSPHNPLHWLPAAERGDRQAMLQLGILYERVDDLPRAETWYRQAADAGAPEAQDRLDFLNRRQAQRAADAQAAGPTHPPAEDPP
jgi:WD40 repeat protein